MVLDLVLFFVVAALRPSKLAKPVGSESVNFTSVCEQVGVDVAAADLHDFSRDDTLVPDVIVIVLDLVVLVLLHLRDVVQVRFPADTHVCQDLDRDRCLVLPPEEAVPVVAPGVEVATLSERHRVVEACHDLCELRVLGGEQRLLALLVNLKGIRNHLHGSVPDFHLALLTLETEFAVFVLAKRVDKAFGGKGEGVERAAADSDDFFVGEVLHKHWLVRRHVEAGPEPAIRAIAPHVQLLGLRDGCAVGLSRRYVDHPQVRQHLDLRRNEDVLVVPVP